MIQKMKKSKGFTLIELLVVIAIIAVLVSIIIPTVSNSTTKAKAATDAANLRSIKAELTIAALEKNDIKGTKSTDTGVSYPGGTTTPPECKTNSAWTLYWEIDSDGNVDVVRYGETGTIEYFAGIAGGTSTPAPSSSANP